MAGHGAILDREHTNRFEMSGTDLAERNGVVAGQGEREAVVVVAGQHDRGGTEEPGRVAGHQAHRAVADHQDRVAGLGPGPRERVEPGREDVAEGQHAVVELTPDDINLPTTALPLLLQPSALSSVVLFSDGFESGDLVAWTNSLP